MRWLEGREAQQHPPSGGAGAAGGALPVPADGPGGFGRRLTRRGLARRGAGGVAAAGGVEVAASCGVDVGGGPRAERRPVTLQYWSRFTGTNPIQAFEEQHLPVFMEKLAPIKVERTGISGSYDDLLEKVTTAFASGTAPDVFTMGSSGVVAYAHPGSAMALDAAPRLKQEVDDFFGPPLAVGRYKGKLYGLTYYIDTRMALYRRDLLAEAGVPTDRRHLPKTWDQFREAMKRVTRWEGGQIARIGFEVPKSGDAKMFMTMVAQQGKNIYNPEGTKVAFDGPEGHKALQMLVDLVHRDRIDSFQRPQFPSGVETLATPYLAGKFANSDVSARVKAAGLDPSAALVTDFIPEFTGKTTAASYLGGTWQMASKGTKDADAAAELIAFLTGPDLTLAIAEAMAAVPARKSVDKAPYLQNAVMRPFYESLQYGWSVPQHPRHREIETKLIEVIGDATQQGKSVPQALADAAAFANGLLAGG